MYGILFRVEQKVNTLISKIKEERLKFKILTKNQPKQKVSYFIWQNPWMVVGSNTYIDAMLIEANLSNVFSSELRYPEIDIEHPKLKEAEVLMLSSEPYPFKQKHIETLKINFPDKKVMLVDGEMFSWYGSRLCNMFSYFIRKNLKN